MLIIVRGIVTEQEQASGEEQRDTLRQAKQHGRHGSKLGATHGCLELNALPQERCHVVEEVAFTQVVERGQEEAHQVAILQKCSS